MSPWRKCLFGCKDVSPLFTLPTEFNRRFKWLEFISEELGKKPSQTVYLCERHFTKDSFQNYGYYQTGLTTKLILNSDAIPTLRGSDDAQPTAATNLLQIPLQSCLVVKGESYISTRHPVTSIVRDVACQTEPSLFPFPKTRSVGTQLSMRTLQNHQRSSCVQVKPSSKDCGVGTRTLPLDSPMLFLQPTLIKRPRLSLPEGEEEGESSAESRLHKPDDST